MKLTNLPRQVRWAIPAGIIVTAGGALAASMITVAAAAATPQLPTRTPAQLIAAVAGKTPAGVPLTGTITETVSLGLPALPSTGAPVSLSTLLTGSRTVNIWYADPAHYRLALPQSASEDDLIRNGTNAWLWESSANQVTHLTLPAGGRSGSALPLSLTPQQAAEQALAQVGPTTEARVDKNVTVAGQAAYELVLAPRSSGSLIGQVRIAIDAARNVPLRVQVFARGAAGPAVQIGYSSVSFGEPAAASFTFQPPAGAIVTQQKTGPDRTATDQASGPQAYSGTAGPSVIGNGWLTVTELAESSLTGTAPPAHSTGPAGSASSALGPLTKSSDSAAGSGLGGALDIGTGSVFTTLLRAASHVRGPWGSGWLVRTSLVSMLVTSNGRVLLGAVTPDVLYQAATQPGHAPAVHGQRAARPARSR
ncbi:MAG: hypothetical protein M3Z75_05180 [Actinomycetota bacterium]|nr:hypothetical protein [Actinomycetota bacterium]